MPAPSRKPRSSGHSSGGGSSLLAGLLIGLFIGVAVAVGVTVYLNRSASPFTGKTPASQSAASQAVETKPEVLRPARGKDEVAPPAAASAAADASTTEFDFYKMLPESESKATRPAPTPVPTAKPKPEASAASKVEAAKGGWLQAGAFQNEADADNLKAKLALIGIESRILTSEVPDKGVWHRVRVGPYATAEELDRTRAQLKANGIDSTVIRSK
ncbi:SPOR domain-containing protein [Chitinilyticum piscinae]|uniref:SPOR domain-containing protein n=1 Tax=Chitinilyticum piscinae TaxID=2866724 RepID=A0A8J7K9E4_9NEIS|nr:SPOR domain-containing protein [Chitinilyticum piscinae]MBE9607984.1 SPOR domain-containing protein [Chitinilyticum piscinae]